MAKWRHTWLVVPLVWLFFGLALHSMVQDSPTMDEQNHIARGITFLRTGDPRLSLEHPPLVNALAALPLLTLPDLRLPTDQPSWQALEPPGAYWYFYADQFLWQYNRPYVNQILFLARLPIVWLTLALALVGFRWARRLWGKWAGWLALALLLFDPNVLAHGRYVTTDLGGTLFAFLAAFQLWRMWHGKWEISQLSIVNRQLLIANNTLTIDHWRLAIGNFFLSAFTLGLAFSSKLSILGFVPIFALLALLPGPDGGSWRGAARRLGQLGGAGLASLWVVWALFGFEWRAFRFGSDLLEGLNQFRGPMPTFWAGIEQILLLSQGGRTAFLLGETTNTGFLAYFPVALGVKTPLLTLLATAVALPLLLKNEATRRHALFLLLPVLGYFVLTLQSGLNIGYRHLLPMLPFMYLLMAGWVAGMGRGGNGRFSFFVFCFLLIVQISTALAIHPHYLSYFNRLAGGPAQGSNILIDSNVDWGQDLRRLAAWVAENEVEEVKLGWFGTAQPDYYGIRYEPLPGLGGVGQPQFFDAWWQLPFDPVQPEPGVYAISVTSLWEFPLATADKHVYAWFRAREPAARIGYSVLVYVVR